MSLCYLIQLNKIQLFYRLNQSCFGPRLQVSHLPLTPDIKNIENNISNKDNNIGSLADNKNNIQNNNNVNNINENANKVEFIKIIIVKVII